MRAFYNDTDRYCCDWLQNLIDAGEIMPGRVDDRSIEALTPDDLEGFNRVHLFAGIAGWDLALQLAGWGDRPVWTASCPCPPFSVAGQPKVCPQCEGKSLVWCPRRSAYAICADCGHEWPADERHLWPEVWRLASIAQPSIIFGEQVASKDGRVWMSAVRASLEILGHAVGVADLPASGVGAFHRRQRLFWVADRDGGGNKRRPSTSIGTEGAGAGTSRRLEGSWGCAASGVRGSADTLADSVGEQTDPSATGRLHAQPSECRQEHGGLADSGSEGRQQDPRGSLGDEGTDGRQSNLDNEPAGSSQDDGLDHTSSPRRRGESEPRKIGSPRVETRMQEPRGRSGSGGLAEPNKQHGRGGTRGEDGPQTCDDSELGDGDSEGWEKRIRVGGSDGEISKPAWRETSIQANPWDNPAWIECGDGRIRPIPKVESGILPLAYGVPGRVGQVRGYGNAIVPELAARFISAYMDC